MIAGASLPQALGREHAPVASEDSALLVDDNWDIEAERCDAFGDAGDLLAGVEARVSLIGPQRLDRQPTDRNPLGCSLAVRDAIRGGNRFGPFGHQDWNPHRVKMDARVEWAPRGGQRSGR